MYSDLNLGGGPSNFFFKQVSTQCTNLQIRGWSSLDFLEQVSTGVLTCGGGGQSTFSCKKQLSTHTCHISTSPPVLDSNMLL